MYNISIIGTTCIDIIHQPDVKTPSRLFGGIIYILTALSGLFKNNGIIIPVTQIEKKYNSPLKTLLKKYPNVTNSYIYDEKGKTNVVELFYNNDRTERVEKNFLGSTPISFKHIKPILNISDLIIITFISGYDISMETLEKIRKNYSKTIFGDIHSYILTKAKDGIRRYKTSCNYERFLKNFDIIQGSEIEWQVLLKKRWKNIKRND